MMSPFSSNCALNLAVAAASASVVAAASSARNLSYGLGDGGAAATVSGEVPTGSEVAAPEASN